MELFDLRTWVTYPRGALLRHVPELDAIGTGRVLFWLRCSVDVLVMGAQVTGHYCEGFPRSDRVCVCDQTLKLRETVRVFVTKR